MIFNINTDAAVKHTARLERLSKSALPVAIRGTLNKAAFDVKQSTMLKSANDEFEKRSPNFFKATSRVAMAKGFNIGTMKSEVGFDPGSAKANKQSVEDLEQQEQGGIIGGRSFIPTRYARAGNKPNKMVRSNARLKSIKDIVNVRDGKGKNDNEKFVKSVVHAGKGGFVLGEHFLWKINSIKRKGGNIISNKTPLYSYSKSRVAKVHYTSFMHTASKRTAVKLEEFYQYEARQQIKRLKNK